MNVGCAVESFSLVFRACHGEARDVAVQRGYEYRSNRASSRNNSSTLQICIIETLASTWPPASLGDGLCFLRFRDGVTRIVVCSLLHILIPLPSQEQTTARAIFQTTEIWSRVHSVGMRMANTVTSMDSYTEV